MLIFEKDIAVDMGTSTTRLYEQGKGIVAREPTVVAMERHTGKVSKIGNEAHKLLGRTPANLVAISPVSAGVISDYEIAAYMLRELVNRVTSFSLFKPCILACVPGSITGVEERAIIDAAIEAGARKVYLIETAVATALGAGVDISKPNGHLIIDIGGGTTEIAVVSGGGVVECESIKTAGLSFDRAIVKYIYDQYDILIGMTTAEELKKNIGGVIQRSDVGNQEVKGKRRADNLNGSVEISSSELIQAFVDPVNKILEAVHFVLERTPSELMGDLSTNGIIMSGGGSQLRGIDKLIERSTGIRTVIVDDAMSCATYGAGKMLLHLDDMQDGMMNYYRKRQLRG